MLLLNMILTFSMACALIPMEWLRQQTILHEKNATGSYAH